MKWIDCKGSKGADYTITINNGIATCQCRGFERWHRCKHARAATLALDAGLWRIRDYPVGDELAPARQSWG